MDGLAPILCVFWVGIAAFAFARGNRPVVVLAIYVLGQLFLPEVQSSPVGPNKVQPIRLPMLEFTKLNAMSYGLFLGMLLFDPPRLGRIRWTRYDLPALFVACFSATSSLLNGNRFDDAFAEFRNSFVLWGIPYIMGRAYLSDMVGCRRAVTAIALGGLLYVPFCLLESRLSPVLHYRLYGFQQHTFAQTMRWGGYRPMVWMQHGLAVGFWMVAAAISMFWLWRSGAWDPPKRFVIVRRMAGTSLIVLAMTAVWCKSLGAVALGIAGVGGLILVDRTRWRLAFVPLLLVAPMYVGVRATGLIHGDQIIAMLGSNVQQERADSLEFRLYSEDRFLAELTKPWIGMGGGADKRPKDLEGKKMIVDGLWLIVYYDSGAIGLVAVLAYFLWPAIRFAQIHPAHTWRWPEVAPAAAAAAVLTIYMIDCLFNAMFNPMYMVLAGALVGWNELAAKHRNHLRQHRE